MRGWPAGKKRGPASAETRAKMSAARLGKPRPNMRGRPATAKQMEGLRKGWAAPKPKMTEERLQKLLAGRRAFKETDEQRAARGRAIAEAMARKSPEDKAAWHRANGLSRRGPRPHKRGMNCHLWRGGISAENSTKRQQDMRTYEYRAWRRAVFERDDFTCKTCGKRGVELHADHIKPYSKFPDLRYEISNGRTLCVKCHRRTETWGFLARTGG